MSLCKITQLFSASQLSSVVRIIWQTTSTGNCEKIIYQGVITAYPSTNKLCCYLFATIFNTYSDPCHFCFISETKSIRKQVSEKKRSSPQHHRVLSSSSLDSFSEIGACSYSASSEPTLRYALPMSTHKPFYGLEEHWQFLQVHMRQHSGLKTRKCCFQWSVPC